MKILLIEDHLLFRDGLKLLLSSLDQNIDFIEVDDLAGLDNLFSNAIADIDMVLADLGLPDANDLDTLTHMQELLPKASIVVLSGQDEAHIIRAAIEQGAVGFIPKSSSREVLIAALKLILAGGSYIPPHALEDHGPVTLSPLVTDENDAVLDRLTARQRDVLNLAMQGKVNKIIARELDISEATVKNHLSACFRALGVNNRTEAVYAAAQIGLKL